MEQHNPLLRETASLSEKQKLELFAIEELETRLEMLGNFGDPIGDGSGGGLYVAGDGNCWSC